LKSWLSLSFKTPPGSAAIVGGMKTLSLALLCLVGSVAAQTNRPPAHAAISTMAWLAGEWVSEAGPVKIEERWTPAAGGAMLAVSRTVKDGRMVEFEFLRIVERDGGLVYIAQPNGRPPTDFVMTAIDARTATFENPAHDFPKMIRYSLRADGRLEARISNGVGKSEAFVFVRAK